MPWVGLPDRLGDLPAVLALDGPEQPPQIPGTPLPHFPSIEEGREPRVERRERFVPGVQIVPMLPNQLLSAAALLHGRAASSAHRLIVK